MPERGVRLPRAVRGVLFDLDGTLADTAGDLAAALNAVRADDGLPPIDPATLRVHASSGARGMLRAGMGIATDHARYDALRLAFLEHYERLLADSTRLFDGVEAMLAALEDRSLPWGIVTNKAERFTTPVVAALGLEGRARTVVSGDTTPHAKPHPAPLLHAAGALGIAPSACVYVGDDLRDILAGNAAGMPSLVAGWGYLGGDQDPALWPAAARMERPADLLTLLA